MSLTFSFPRWRDATSRTYTIRRRRIVSARMTTVTAHLYILHLQHNYATPDPYAFIVARTLQRAGTRDKSGLIKWRTRVKERTQIIACIPSFMTANRYVFSTLNRMSIHTMRFIFSSKYKSTRLAFNYYWYVVVLITDSWYSPLILFLSLSVIFFCNRACRTRRRDCEGKKNKKNARRKRKSSLIYVADYLNRKKSVKCGRGCAHTRFP